MQTPTVGLGRLIQENLFFVPKHQRDYSWTSELIDQFLEDIENAFDSKNEEYFLGLMVFTKNETDNRLNVIDGQQRLATALILLSAIRNWMSHYSGHNKASTQISDRYIAYSRLGSDDAQPKLLLNSANNYIFEKIIIKQVPIDDVNKLDEATKRGDRSKAIIEAAIIIDSYVKKRAIKFNSPDLAAGYFIDLIEYMDSSVRVVSLMPGGDEDAYTIFETLNDRGLTLAPLDLVKNFLFGKAERLRSGVGLRDMEARWNEMMTVLERSKPGSFFRAYWASRYGLTEGPKLFSAFKERFKEPRDAQKASIEMKSVSENYVALSDPGDPTWTPIKGARESIEAISVIGATQLYPLILAAMERFNPQELGRLLRLIEVIGVRYQLVARGRPGRMESLGAQIAKKIFEKGIENATQIRSELTELYPSDESFESDFATKSEKDKRKQHYLLKALERQNRRMHNIPHAEEFQIGDVTVEHIMSRSLSASLKSYLGADKDKHNEYRDRIGNLCLWGKANAKHGDALFAAKKPDYSSSSITITNSLSQYEEWRCNQIDQRQKALAKLAVQAWRFQ